jgi:hypothetical protein
VTGCGWLRSCWRIQTINPRDVRARDQVSVRVHCDLNAAVTHLLLHVREGRALLDQQAAESVPEVVEADVTQSCCLDRRCEVTGRRGASRAEASCRR